MVDKSGVTNYQYDAFGNVTLTERKIDGVWYNTVYTYDVQDRVSTVTYPSGRKITYLRDKAGRVFRVKQKIGGVETDVITGRGYRGDHQFITQTLGNGLKETRKYDLQGRMYELKLADGGTTVYFRHFDYDASGNVTARKVDASLNNSVYDADFGYDVLDRLTSEDHGSQWQSPVPGEPVLYPTTFGYTDPDGGGWKANNGNRRQMARNGSTTNLSYTNNSNRLTSDSNQNLTYDAAGNQTGKDTDSWVYDPRGLIKQYRQNGSTVAAYTYDYRSLRSKKALTNAETVVYLYDLQGQLIAEYENGSLKREYVWLDGAPLAQIDAATGGDSITWFTTDHLFTPRVGTDSSKEPVWQWDSYAFGETAPYLPTGSSGTMPTVNLRFPGQYFDNESGSHYNWHRHYESTTGRYITSDPIGLNGGFNTYLYAFNNPMFFLDKYGLQNRGLYDDVDGLVGGEAHFILGGGFTVVTCQTECGNSRSMLFVKGCAGAAFGLTGNVGVVGKGLDGENCKPSSYAGFFGEIGAVAAGLFGGFIDIGDGVLEGGWSIGVSAQASVCYYIYVGDI